MAFTARECRLLGHSRVAYYQIPAFLRVIFLFFLLLLEELRLRALNLT